MIGQVEHYISLHNDIGYAVFSEQRMIKRFFACTFFLKYLLGKVHEVAKIMNAATRNKIVSLGQVQAANQVFQQTRVHFMVIYKTYRLSFAPVPQTFCEALDKTCGDIAVNIYLCITGYFENMRFVLVISEEEKNFGEVKPDDNFQQDNIMFTVGCRQQ